MKICTVNLPQAYIKTIEGMVGDSGLYPSRSELIRVACREFLIKEIAIAKNIESQKSIAVPLDENIPIGNMSKDFVRVPMGNQEKIYRIVQK